jgi:hypothetical protein
VHVNVCENDHNASIQKRFLFEKIVGFSDFRTSEEKIFEFYFSFMEKGVNSTKKKFMLCKFKNFNLCSLCLSGPGTVRFVGFASLNGRFFSNFFHNHARHSDSFDC